MSLIETLVTYQHCEYPDCGHTWLMTTQPSRQYPGCGRCNWNGGPETERPRLAKSIPIIKPIFAKVLSEAEMRRLHIQQPHAAKASINM